MLQLNNLIQILINSGIEPNEAKKEIKMLLEHFCNYTETDSIKGRQLTVDEFKLLEEKVQLRIKDNTPIQHIIGEAWFMGEYFKVTPDVLIPRDETEILVRKAIETIEIVEKFNKKYVL